MSLTRSTRTATSFAKRKTGRCADSSRRALPDEATRLAGAPLCVECATAFGAEGGLEEVCKDAVELCMRAIRTTLAVVANTAASATEEEEDVDIDVGVNSKGHRGTPLNVNQGIIGAKASFAAVRENNKEERAIRTTVQQLVVSAEREIPTSP